MPRVTVCVSLFVVALAGCERCNRTSVTDAGGADVATAPPAADASADAPPDASTHARVPTPAERKRYTDALARGRAATVAKEYPAAITAFGEALVAIPSDARALSERGYARFLSGDDNGAEKDFNSAVDAVPKSDRKLTAQIYYNLGLAAEKHGDSRAGAYFRSSYEYNPTAAAKAKMSTCPVTMNGAFDIDSIDKLDDYQTAEDAGLGNVTRLLIDEQNKAYTAAADDDESARVLLPKPAGGYFRFDSHAKLTMFRSRFCCLERGLQDSVDVVRDGAFWIVTVQPMVEGITECPCGNCKLGETIPDYRNNGNMKCDDSPLSNEKGPCIPCGGWIDQGVGWGPTLTPGGSREVFYVNAATGAATWDVSYDTAFDKTVKLAIEGGKLHVTGEGCDITAPPP